MIGGWKGERESQSTSSWVWVNETPSGGDAPTQEMTLSKGEARLRMPPLGVSLPSLLVFGVSYKKAWPVRTADCYFYLLETAFSSA